MERFDVFVPAECAGQRADRFLADLEEIELTRSALQRLFEQGLVQCGEKPVAKNLKLKAGDHLTVDLPDAKPLEAQPQNIPLEIVYEDEYLLVVNKPKGMVVHPAPGSPDGTLVNALLYHCAGRLSSIGGVVRPGIVHRIDKDTSGLLVVAKNDAAHLSLSAQIADKTCAREYLALCDGIFGQDSGRVETYIGRHPADRLKMAVVPAGKGKYAATNYDVVERFPQGYTLVHFVLETGRTHQIRVHCKYLGHPVTGDPVYGSKKQKFNLNGQLLHAFRLTLTHPRTGERMTFEAPLPAYFRKVLDALRGRAGDGGEKA